MAQAAPDTIERAQRAAALVDEDARGIHSQGWSGSRHPGAAHGPGRPTTVTATTGGAAVVTHRLAAYRDATARLEVARSYYAVDQDALDLSPRRGVAAFAGRQATLGE